MTSPEIEMVEGPLTPAPRLFYDEAHDDLIRGGQEGPDARQLYYRPLVPKHEPGYRSPVDAYEAVRADRAGVLERNMDGIPHGPGGWHRNGLAESWVLLEWSGFRVPIGWSTDA